MQQTTAKTMVGFAVPHWGPARGGGEGGGGRVGAGMTCCPQVVMKRRRAGTMGPVRAGEMGRAGHLTFSGCGRGPRGVTASSAARQGCRAPVRDWTRCGWVTERAGRPRHRYHWQRPSRPATGGAHTRSRTRRRIWEVGWTACVLTNIPKDVQVTSNAGQAPATNTVQAGRAHPPLRMGNGAAHLAGT